MPWGESGEGAGLGEEVDDVFHHVLFDNLLRVSSQGVAKFLTEGGRIMWAERARRWVVLLDEDSTPSTIASAQRELPIITLKDSLYKVVCACCDTCVGVLVYVLCVYVFVCVCVCGCACVGMLCAYVLFLAVGHLSVYETRASCVGWRLWAMVRLLRALVCGSVEEEREDNFNE